MYFNKDREALQACLTAATRTYATTSGLKLPLTVDSEKPRNHKYRDDYYRCWGKSVEIFLEHVRFNSLLLGAPGAGKSFALRNHVAAVASWILQQTLSPATAEKDLAPLPIYVDLKEYSGSLEELLQPWHSKLDLRNWAAAGRASFLIDSFNEAPRRFVNSGELADDLSEWMDAAPKCRWIIASRTEEALDFFDGEHFQLTNIDKDYVRSTLERRDIDLTQSLGEDLVQLLRKPIFFCAFMNDRLSLREGRCHPAEAIESMIQSYVDELHVDFAATLDLPAALGPLAVSAVDRGEELMARSDVVAAFQRQLASTGNDRHAEAMIDQLLDAGLLLAYSRDQIALNHQSLTEMIAAKNIASRLQANMNLVDELLTSTRWDESIHLVTHYLDLPATRQLFERIMNRDVALAARCIRFSEFDRHRLVSFMLDFIVSEDDARRASDYPFWAAVGRLPVDLVHIAQLRQMLARKSHMAGAAAKLLLNLLGDDAIEMVIDGVFARPDDFNFGQDSGMEIVDRIRPEHVAKTIDRIEASPWSNENREKYHGVVMFFRWAFQKLDPEFVVNAFRERGFASRALVEVMNEWAHSAKDATSLFLLIDLVLQGFQQAAINLLMRMQYRSTGYPSPYDNPLDELDANRLEQLFHRVEETLADVEQCRWTIELIGILCRDDASAAEWFRQLADRSDNVLKIALLSAMPDCVDEFWSAAEVLFADPKRRFEVAEYALLQSLQNVVWTDREEYLLKLFTRKDSELTDCLIGGVEDLHLDATISWSWLEDLLPWFADYSSGSRGWLIQKFCEFVARHSDDELRQQMIAEINRSESEFRALFADELVPWMGRYSLTDFTAETIEYLIARLHDKKITSYPPHILSDIVTEVMVNEQLLPLLSDERQPFRDNLRVVLAKAGDRHRKRYV